MTPEWKKVVVRRCDKGNCDVELCYEARGDPSHPTVLLVMGLNCQAVVWHEDFCDMIVKAGYHVIRYDNRDVGFSTKFDHMPCAPMWKLLYGGGQGVYTLLDMAEDGVALLNKLGVQRAHWVGVSMGGMISQVAAIHFPQNVLSLTSIMSGTNNKQVPGPSLKVQLSLMGKPKSEEVNDLIEFKVGYIKRILLAGIPPEDYAGFPEEIVPKHVARTTYNKGTVRQIYAVAKATNRDDALSKLKCPVGVIHGKQDILVRPEHGLHTAAVAANAHLTMIDKMGHYIYPAVFPQVVDAILSTCKRGDAMG